MRFFTIFLVSITDMMAQISEEIPVYISIFEYIQAHKRITLKIFSFNATVSLLLMGLQILILFCIY